MKYRFTLPKAQNDLVKSLRLLNNLRTKGQWVGQGDQVFVGDEQLTFTHSDPDTVFLAFMTEHAEEIVKIIEQRYVIV